MKCFSLLTKIQLLVYSCQTQFCTGKCRNQWPTWKQALAPNLMPNFMVSTSEDIGCSHFRKQPLIAEAEGDLGSCAVLTRSYRHQWSTFQCPLSQILPELYKWKDLTNHWLEISSNYVPLTMCSWPTLLLSLKPLKWVAGAARPCISVAYKSSRTHESSLVVATWQHKSLRHIVKNHSRTE